MRQVPSLPSLITSLGSLAAAIRAMAGRVGQLLVFVHAHTVGDIQVRHGHCCLWVLPPQCRALSTQTTTIITGHNYQAPVIAIAAKSVLQNGTSADPPRCPAYPFHKAQHARSFELMHALEMFTFRTLTAQLDSRECASSSLGHCWVLNGVALLLQPRPSHSLQTFRKKLHS